MRRRNIGKQQQSPFFAEGRGTGGRNHTMTKHTPRRRFLSMALCLLLVIGSAPAASAEEGAGTGDVATLTVGSNAPVSFASFDDVITSVGAISAGETALLTMFADANGVSSDLTVPVDVGLTIELAGHGIHFTEVGRRRISPAAHRQYHI
jgi:hypothetical protein